MNPYPCVIVVFAASIACATGQAQRFSPAPSSANRQARAYTSWTVFSHPRYGYELPIPPGVRAVSAPDAATTPKFVSSDGLFELSAWGGMSSGSPSKVFEAQWKSAHRHGDREITYQRKGSTWFVVSGTDRAGIEFYEKFTMSGQQVAALSVRFPRVRLREFESWVETIEDGFRPVAIRDQSPEMAPQLMQDQGYRQESESPPSDRKTSSTRKSELAPKRSTTPTPTENVPKISPKADEPTNTADLPVGEKIVGKTGFVYSPFSSENRIVDVTSIPSGTKVKCPYTMKIFRVP